MPLYCFAFFYFSSSCGLLFVATAQIHFLLPPNHSQNYAQLTKLINFCTSILHIFILIITIISNFFSKFAIKNLPLVLNFKADAISIYQQPTHSNTILYCTVL